MAKKTSASTVSMATVLSFSRTFNPSDGFFSSCDWANTASLLTVPHEPVFVTEKTVVGSNGSRTKEGGMEFSSANPQLIETARLPREHNTLLIEFGLTCCPFRGPHTCNNADFARRLQARTPELMEKIILIPVLRRMVKNLLHGAHGWRNRMNGDRLRTEIFMQIPEQMPLRLASCELTDYPDIRFETDNALSEPGAETVVERLYETLCGTSVSPLHLLVKTAIHMGRGAEVYPSQDFVLKDRFSAKDINKPGRLLYKVNFSRQAGMHSQKIGNALRTIDTWYPSDDKDLILPGTPISIEPYGSIPSRGLALRRGGRDGKGKDFFTLFDAFFLSGEMPDYDLHDKMYMISILFRGGVFGGEDKNKKVTVDMED